MSIALVVFWALFFCTVAVVIILSFPVSFTQDVIKKGLLKLQQKFLYINIIACILIAIMNNPPNNFIKVFVILPFIDIRIALMIIPAIACIIFSLGLYYPSARFLVKSNLLDRETIDKLIELIFTCAYGDNDNRQKALYDFDTFCMKQGKFITQYGLNVYIDEYKNHTNNITLKPPIELTKYVLDMCSRVKYDIDNFNPTPFPNIGLILSFIFSTVLTVLLSIITITP